MNAAPLKVEVKVSPDARPVLDALNRLHRDVGSIAARLVFPNIGPEHHDMRIICVGCVDQDDVEKLAWDLAKELGDDHASAKLASKVAICEMTMGLYVVAFLELPCLGAEGEIQ